MNLTARRTVVGGVALAAGLFAVLPGTAGAAPAPAYGHFGHPHPVFVQNDDPAGNAIAVYDRAADGSLDWAGSYATGGLGGALDGSVVDHLGSQGSLAYDRAHRLLYAVNAGSDTVTVFAVHGERLDRLQVIGSGGTFPVSIAVHGSVLYVLNARDGGSVQGYLRVGAGLLRVPFWHRDLGLDPSLTPEFTSTPGQVAFSPDGRRLIVTTKGNGNDIDVFGVDVFGGLSAAPVVTADPGAVPFAVTFDSAGHLVVAEAGTNAVARFAIRPDGGLAFIDRTATGQAATCWIAGTRGYLYASNTGSASLSGFAGGAALTPLGNTATDAGTVDAAASSDGRFLYVQTGAAGIVDEFHIESDGSLRSIGSVTVPGAVGGEGIAAD